MSTQIRRHPCNALRFGPRSPPASFAGQPLSMKLEALHKKAQLVDVIVPTIALVKTRPLIPALS